MSDLFSMTVENLVDGPDCPQAEVVDICSRMIQIDSQNFGPQDARGEVEMCHYVTGLLDEIGVGVTLHESEPACHLGRRVGAGRYRYESSRPAAARP